MTELPLLIIIAFFKQTAGAVAGASALLSLLFHMKKRGELLPILYALTEISSLIFIVLWVIVFFFFPELASAHVGTSTPPMLTEEFRSFPFQMPFVMILLFLVLLSSRNLPKKTQALPLCIFLTVSVLLSTYAISDSLRKELFYIIHGWHSILTLGMVITLDWLFVHTHHDWKHFKMVTSVFPVLSLLIFTGLALDLASTLLIFEESFHIDTRFFFMQTIVGILIINGVVLAGPLSRRLISSLRLSHHIPPKLTLLLGLAGSISLASWTTNTFIDFFPALNVTYSTLMLFYLLFITILFIGQLLVEGWPFGTKALAK